MSQNREGFNPNSPATNTGTAAPVPAATAPAVPELPQHSLRPHRTTVRRFPKPPRTRKIT